MTTAPPAAEPKRLVVASAGTGDHRARSPHDGHGGRHRRRFPNQQLQAAIDLLVAKTVLLAATATELGDRIGRAATELAVLLRAGVEDQIAQRAWSSYQHQFAGNATRAERTVADVAFDSPLMRLAAGGGAGPRQAA